MDKLILRILGEGGREARKVDDRRTEDWRSFNGTLSRDRQS
jgi:hypothetical protein